MISITQMRTLAHTNALVHVSIAATYYRQDPTAPSLSLAPHTHIHTQTQTQTQTHTDECRQHNTVPNAYAHLFPTRYMFVRATHLLPLTVNPHVSIRRGSTEHAHTHTADTRTHASIASMLSTGRLNTVCSHHRPPSMHCMPAMLPPRVCVCACVGLRTSTAWCARHSPSAHH